MRREVDPLVHPALMDPRQMTDIDIYELAPPLERGEPKGEPNYAPSRAFDVEHTRLELELDQEEGRVRGRATITVRPFADGLSEVWFDAAEMSFSRVAIKRGRRWKEARSFKTYEEKVWIALDESPREGRPLTILLEYSCRPRAGLYFIRPDEANPDQPVQVWSQGEAADNHYWFPCFDHPNDKMTSEVILTVGADQVALSNGRLVSAKENKKARTRTYHYSHERPHSAYLVSIAVGTYAEIKDSYKGRPVRYYVYPDRVADAAALFRKTPDMMKHFSKIFDFEYPYPKYDQVIVSEFLFGAMENTTATTIADRALLDSQAARDVSNEDLVSHELAHQWWGDMVTCKDWAHLWLNEAFATYSESLYKERDAGWDETRFYLIQEYITYIQEDRGRYRRPIVSNRYTYPTEMFDRHTYQKGELVVDMLRFVLGDHAFYKAIRHYLKKFQWQTTETDDLRRAIEEVTGQNLDWFFDQWLMKGGYPEFEVVQSYDAAAKLLRLSVRQTQKVDELTPVFKTPVEIEVITRSGPRVVRVMIERAEHDFYFEVESPPLAVSFDRFNRVLKRLSFDRPKEDLIYLLKQSDDVTARLRAARELGAFAGRDVVGALGQAVDKDRFWGVKVAALSALGEIGGDEALEILVNRYDRSADARVRRGAVWGIGAYKKDERAYATLKRALEQDESLFVATTAIRAIGNSGDATAFDVITKALDRDSFQDVIRAAVFDALAFMKDKRGIDLAIEWSREGRPKGARIGAIGALGALAKEHKGERERVIRHLAETLKDNSARVRLAATRALGRTNDPAVLNTLREVERTEAISQIRVASHRAIESIEESARKAQ
ncbi:MAG TPA: M1 family aminopeptidase [Blastocatellia bacterium]|nr:M1 family aminopeptidase [Blastocatellia bacterium]